jgi:ABC-2 type transport system permease protein
MDSWIAIIRLDLALFLRDRKALVLLYLVPVLMAAFFGQLTGGTGGKAERSAIGLVLVDLDGSAASRGVVAAFTNDSTFAVVVTNEAAARARVTAGRVPVGLVFPPGFSTNLLQGIFQSDRRPVVTLLFDPSHETERSLLEGMLVPKVVSGVADGLLNVDVGRDLIARGRTNILRAQRLPEIQRRLLLDSLSQADAFLESRRTSVARTNVVAGPSELPLPYRVDAQPLTRVAGARYNGFAHSFAGMSLQFVLMVMIDLAVGLLTERQSGTFRRLRAAPLSRATLLLGKATSYAIIALSTFVVSFAVAMSAFGVRIHGSWIGFVAVILALCYFSATLALALAAIGRTPKATRGLAIPVVLILLMLGGAWIPSFIFPSWVRTVSLWMPTGWGIEALDAMTWRGLDVSAVFLPVAGLVAVGTLLGGIAWRRFRWDGEAGS